jgi:hypothetical protein
MPGPAWKRAIACCGCIKVSKRKAQGEESFDSGHEANTRLMAERMYKKQKTSAEMDRELAEFNEYVATLDGRLHHLASVLKKTS